MILVIADDFTGAAELAGVGLAHGLKVELLIGNVVPSPGTEMLVLAGEPEEDPVTVTDMATTVYNQLGITGDKELMAPGNRVELLVKARPYSGLFPLRAIEYEQGHPGGARPQRPPGRPPDNAAAARHWPDPVAAPVSAAAAATPASAPRTRKTPSAGSA